MVDRPVATYVDQTVYSSPQVAWATYLFVGLTVAGGGLGLISLGLLVGLVRGWWRGSLVWTILMACGAGTASLVLAELLKYLIGRSTIYPAYFLHGINALSPGHGGPDYGSFPSATMAGLSGVVSVLWLSWPRGRAAYALTLLGIAFAIVFTNAHWVSDTLAGGLLGAVLGSVLHLKLPPPDQRPSIEHAA